jgi:hypothetical protein
VNGRWVEVFPYGKPEDKTQWEDNIKYLPRCMLKSANMLVQRMK